MKSFKEIARNIIPLSESVFDMEGDDRIGRGVEKDISSMFLNTCKGKYKYISLKDGSVKINGKLIISNIDAESIPLKCKDFHGQLIVENCPNLKTFEGSFLDGFIVFDGSITINQCPSLESIKGLPVIIKGDLSVTNCKKLKSIESSIEDVWGNLYWHGNGKKFTPEQIEQHMHCSKQIFCSVEDEEADVNEGVVNEAFNNPWLQRLAKQLKKYPWKEYSWSDDKEPLHYNTVDSIFNSFGRKSNFGGRMLDKITSEDIDVYDMSNESDKKDLAKAFYKSYSDDDAYGSDLILVYDEKLGEFVRGYGSITKQRGVQNKGIKVFDIPNSSRSVSNKINDYFYSKTDAKENLLHYGIGYTVIVINNNKSNSGSARRELQFARSKAREDVINPGDAEQYRKIAQANIARYKEIIAKNRTAAKKNNDVYDKIIDKFEAIMLRVVKLTRMIAKDPAAFTRYRVDEFLNWIRDEERRNPNYKWNGKGGPLYYGEYGLMYRFKEYMDAYMACFGQSYKSAPDKYDHDRLESQLKSLTVALEKADAELTKLGA